MLKTTSGCKDSINKGTKTQHLRQEKILTGSLFIPYNITIETSGEPYQAILSTILEDSFIVRDHMITRPLLWSSNKKRTPTSPVNVYYPIAPKTTRR